jgi:predicted HAD superfamily Cof-like phosphohydrolase
MQISLLTDTIYSQLYRNILQFRSTFDLPCESPSSLDSKADMLHNSLIIEELTELAEATCKIEQADAIIDSVYVLMGHAVHLGNSKKEDNVTISYLVDLLLNVAKTKKIDFLACWNEIHASNMSKVCKSHQEFKDTVAFYEKQGVKLTGSIKGDFIIAKCAQDVQLTGKIVRQGKVLKSVYYRPADLSNIVDLI